VEGVSFPPDVSVSFVSNPDPQATAGEFRHKNTKAAEEMAGLRTINFGTSSTGRNRLYCQSTKQDGANTVTATEVDLEYERRWKAMSHAEKVSRSAAMFAWTRQQMARRIRHDEPNLSDEEIKWRVALKLYEREPHVVKLIQEHLANVSR